MLQRKVWFKDWGMLCDSSEKFKRKRWHNIFTRIYGDVLVVYAEPSEIKKEKYILHKRKLSKCVKLPFGLYKSS